jgi:UDP-glucuronate 4-epimerase
MNILITGAAGFIGSHLCNYLNKKKIDNIIAVDNLDPYYDVSLKKARIKLINKNVNFINLDLRNKQKLLNLFKKYKFKKVIHLAAQPGVRYSLTNPTTYFENNLLAFYNLIEFSRQFKVKHFIYASSSSVYGNIKKFPLKEEYSTNKPVSFYATTKKCNELIADSYFLNFNLNCTGLRFFTVYGPYGRPDMSLFKFVNAGISNKKINIFNNGKHVRDFTYIEDVVDAIYKIVKNKKKNISHQIYNIAGGKPNSLKNYILEIEKILKKKIKKKNISLQKGDVIKTHADVTKLKKDYQFKAKHDLKRGLKKYIEWFKEYY